MFEPIVRIRHFFPNLRERRVLTIYNLILLCTLYLSIIHVTMLVYVTMLRHKMMYEYIKHKIKINIYTHYIQFHIDDLCHRLLLFCTRVLYANNKR